MQQSHWVPNHHPVFCFEKGQTSKSSSGLFTFYKGVLNKVNEFKSFSKQLNYRYEKDKY